jgi:hypothetical protein
VRPGKLPRGLGQLAKLGLIVDAVLQLVSLDGSHVQIAKVEERRIDGLREQLGVQIIPAPELGMGRFVLERSGVVGLRDQALG